MKKLTVPNQLCRICNPAHYPFGFFIRLKKKIILIYSRHFFEVGYAGLTLVPRRICNPALDLVAVPDLQSGTLSLRIFNPHLKENTINLFQTFF